VNAEIKQASRLVREAKGEMVRRTQKGQPVPRAELIATGSSLRELEVLVKQAQLLVGRVPTHGDKETKR
jgi:hypothetical protein